ncbi:DUF551 domain-containing protein [Aggregatibacter kilianii]|uniref:DUF551 domain-containing protein n=1 Tax=Aggregatibacter kilianii TaxID=2025884 RepID=UPI001EF99416|nr:DUF551 domain-containing protein [Aggregatibacter kilianii]
MKKYFAYDALEREFTTHDTLEEAKSQAQDCVDQTFEFGTNDGFDTDLEDAIKEGCFGVVLGGFDLPTRPLTEEEKELYADEFTHMVENPVLVEYPQNEWIKCLDRLPDPLQTDYEHRSEENKHIIYYTEDGDYWFIGFGWYLYDQKEDCQGNLIPYWESVENIGEEVEVIYWQPLPKRPSE